MFCGLYGQVLSSAVFFMERWSFSLQDPIFLYFSDFQRLVRVRSASID